MICVNGIIECLKEPERYVSFFIIVFILLAVYYVYIFIITQENDLPL